MARPVIDSILRFWKVSYLLMLLCYGQAVCLGVYVRVENKWKLLYRCFNYLFRVTYMSAYQTMYIFFLHIGPIKVKVITLVVWEVDTQY